MIQEIAVEKVTRWKVGIIDIETWTRLGKTKFSYMF